MYTVCSYEVAAASDPGNTDQPDTTRAGRPTDRAKATKALLKFPQVPFRLSNRNQSTGSRPVETPLATGSANA